MNNIEVSVLNPYQIIEGERMAACAARLTQRGEKIASLEDFEKLYNRDYSADFVRGLTGLPHPTLQKFSVINVVVVGASRRFLAQITRHQNEVKFMSASLQYSDYSGAADFVVPYEIIDSPSATTAYLTACEDAMCTYEEMIKSGVNNDTAGYAMPQGLRNVLIISATPYQWKHMIHQRVCRRNTDETRYVMLKIWHELFKFSPALFNTKTTGAFCQMPDGCKEGRMCCGYVIPADLTPAAILERDFPKLFKEAANEGTN